MIDIIIFMRAAKTQLTRNSIVFKLPSFFFVRRLHPTKKFTFFFTSVHAIRFLFRQREKKNERKKKHSIQKGGIYDKITI